MFRSDLFSEALKMFRELIDVLIDLRDELRAHREQSERHHRKGSLL